MDIDEEDDDAELNELEEVEAVELVEAESDNGIVCWTLVAKFLMVVGEVDEERGIFVWIKGVIFDVHEDIEVAVLSWSGVSKSSFLFDVWKCL